MQSKVHKQIFSLLLILTFISGCGQSAEQKTNSKLISAEIHLSKRECQQSINLLEGMGRQNKNARYLKLLASSYACRSGYSTTAFFGNDIALTATPSPLGGMTKYSTSLESFTAPLSDDAKFEDLQTAIDILFYAGGLSTTTEPTSIARAALFEANEASDINSQLAFMMFVQLGRFMKVYADADAAGAKGGGSASNVCFSDYSTIDNNVEAILTAQTGACTVKNSPHAQLDSALVSVATRRARLCQGIVLLNGILDLLPSILVSAGGGDLNDIATVTSDIDTAKDALETAYPAIGPVLTVLSQANCEASATITTQTIESYYATIFEAMIK